jgi:hypothetical protein
VFWAVFFARVLAHPPDAGFDAAAHLAYVDWLAEHRALPHPGEGSAMYHPPLYHAATAALRGAATPLGVGARAIPLLLPMAAGLGMAFVARALARVLVPGAPWIEAGAAIVAGLLPMSLTIAASPSNEGPFALLASAALLVAVRALARPHAATRDDLAVGALLGAAALTKYSALLWAPLLLGALAAKRLFAERRGLAPTAGAAALGGALVVALAGWVYARNALLTGDPLVWNLNATPGETWWQLPGFHTADWFSRFGDALEAPWFASFHSFWDSLYTTLWGDGLLSGAVGPRAAFRRWRYDAMAAGFLLALPASALVAVGWLRAGRAALRPGDRGRRIAWSLLFALPPLLLASIASVSLRYPFWSIAKAFYALALTPVLGLFAALGFAALDAAAARAPLAIRALPWAWAGAWLAAIAWSYAG